MRRLVEALSKGQAEAFLAQRLDIDIDGRLVLRDEAIAWLRMASRSKPSLDKVTVKRNLTFCDGEWPGAGAGVAILCWDQHGLVTSVTVKLR